MEMKVQSLYSQFAADPLPHAIELGQGFSIAVELAQE